MSLFPPSFVIAKVEYRLFSFEFEHIRQRLAEDAIEIDCEFVLHGADGACMYISSLMSKKSYFVALAETSFFVPDADIKHIDVSENHLWKDFIGAPAVASYANDDNKQILELRAGKTQNYCCAYGEGYWDVDMIYIGRVIPPLATTN